MLIRLDPSQPVPVYEQIVEGIVAQIRNGELVPGERLPTVRQLAGDLGVAANTAAKAYRTLEEQGHVETHGRGGTTVGAATAPSLPSNRAADDFASVARAAGMSLEQAVGLLRRTWR